MISLRTKGRGPSVPATPSIRVWPGPNGAGLVHPVSGALRPGAAGTPWAHDGFTLRRVADGSIVTAAPTQDLGLQRQAIIETALAAAQEGKTDAD